MERIVWNVLKRFRCIAERCPDSCCKDWAVDVDSVSAQNYLALDGALGARLRQVLKQDDGQYYMELEQGRCPMWRKDGLCSIQAELGHDALCQVCREYPRLYMDFGDFQEWGLELSCPEAARLLLQDMSAETLHFDSGEEAEYDAECMAILKRSQAETLSFLRSSPLPINEILAVLLLYAHGVQGEIDGGLESALNAADCIAEAKKYAGTPDACALVDFFQNLEILTDRWAEQLNNVSANYRICMQQELQLRNLIAYFVRRYWLQAVWDYDLVCRVKFILAACILIMGMGHDVLSNAQLFSKEIENDPDNRNAILDAAYSSPSFTDANLLGLLLNF